MKKAVFIDRLNILSKLTFTRFYNIFLLKTSYVLNQLFRSKDIHWGMPYSVSMEPTTSCNLRCKECPSGLRQFSRNTGYMAEDTFKNTVDQLHKHLMYMILYFQGEPYLNKHLFEFVSYARKKKIYTATSTNAHFLSDENCRKTIQSGLDRLIVSFDGIGQETYEKYRVGGNFEKVKKGLQNIIRWKNELKSNTPHVIVQFIVFGTNEHQMEEVKTFCDELGVDELQFKTAQIYHYEKGSPLIPKNEKYSRYKRNEDGTYSLKSTLPNKCYRMWTSNVITWDGKVVPCCFDKDADHQLGDVSKDNMKDIINNKDYIAFRKQVFSDRKKIEICRNCIEGLKS